MEYLTKKEVLERISLYEPDTKFCTECLTALIDDAEGVLYCPNEMCLNDERSDDEC